MGDHAERLGIRLLWSLVPLLTGLVAMGLDVLPVPLPRPLAPWALVCVFYFWTLYRPDLLPVSAVFGLGLLADAVAGLPLGLTALALLLARVVIVSAQRFLLAQRFVVVWACFLPVLALVGALRWALASLFWSRAFPPGPLLVEAGSTFSVYPLIGWLLAGLQRGLADAARG